MGPGPSDVSPRILEAMARPTIGHLDPAFQVLMDEIKELLRYVFKTENKLTFPVSAPGSAGMETCFANLVEKGDKVIVCVNGVFGNRMVENVVRCGGEAIVIQDEWGTPVSINKLEEELKANPDAKIVAFVAAETSTGVASKIGEIREAMDSVNHPALYMVDTISSLASIDFKHDEWKVDVTVGGSQKGLLLPPGLSFNALSPKALEAHKQATMPKHYWDWLPMIENNKNGFFPFTPATNLVYGLDEAINMLLEEGLENVFARHTRHAEATRIAVRAWGLEILCKNEDEYSNSLTAVLLPDGHDADNFRKIVLEEFDMSLGMGLNKVKGKVFRIGHLGDFNDLMLAGTLSGVEMGLKKAGIPFKPGGIMAALDYLAK